MAMLNNVYFCQISSCYSSEFIHLSIDMQVYYFIMCITILMYFHWGLDSKQVFIYHPMCTKKQIHIFDV